jgi:two-component system OmpR family sensor kinase
LARARRLTDDMTTDVRPVRSWRWLLVAFAGIALLFATTNLLTWQRGRSLRSEIEGAMRDSLASAELVSRLGRDLQGERQLIDSHILEHERSGMSLLETRVAELQRDFDATAASYAPYADQREEAGVLRALQADVAAVKPQLSSVLALSREDRDADARAVLPLVDDRFARLHEDVIRLSELNRAGAAAALARLDAGVDELTLLLGALALAGIFSTALVGAFAIRLVHRREVQLMRYSSALEMQNHELDAFASRVAHDLRGPLTSTRLATWRLVERGERDNAQVAERINRNVARMEALIDDLLTLSRVGAQARGSGVCDPAAVAGAVRDELTPRLRSLTGTLRVDVAPARVRCGEGLLVAALTNLADNAIKYCRADAPPEVVIVGREVGRGYELRVADNGIGMSLEERTQAFAPFYRAKRAQSAPGTGLGLSIVKRIAEASGGDIAIESTVDQGTTFVMHLPVEH